MWAAARRAALAPLLATVAAVVASSIALLLSGNNPIDAFREMWKVIDSTRSVVTIVNTAVPYYVAGVAVAIGFKMNLFNIGVNGQYLLATLFAAYLGSELDLPAPLHVAFILAVAMLVGGVWAGIAGVLKVTRNVNEVISTIMLNYIAIGLSQYLLSQHFRDKSPNASLVVGTKSLEDSALLPPLNRLFEAVGFHFGRGLELHGFLPFAIALGIGYYIMLFRSRFGYELRISGVNPSAARAAGVDPKRMVLTTIALSGALAGLIGMSALLADPQFGHRYGDGFPTTLGFTGLALALLGRNHPAGIAAAALVWAGIARATQPLGPLGIPSEVGVILQGSFLLAAVIAFEWVRRRNERSVADEAASRAASGSDAAPGASVQDSAVAGATA